MCVVTPRQERRQRQRESDLAAYRAGRRRYRTRRNARERDLVFGHYGRACACCGTTERLTIDHVNGDGAEHRAAMRNRGGGHTYHWLVVNGFPSGFQTLCWPCNNSKARGLRCRINHEESETGAAPYTPAGLWIAC